MVLFPSPHIEFLFHYGSVMPYGHGEDNAIPQVKAWKNEFIHLSTFHLATKQQALSGSAVCSMLDTGMGGRCTPGLPQNPEAENKLCGWQLVQFLRLSASSSPSFVENLKHPGQPLEFLK